MSSILTNNGAMVALQTLKNVNSNLNKAQSEISTGFRVATAKLEWKTFKLYVSVGT